MRALERGIGYNMPISKDGLIGYYANQFNINVRLVDLEKSSDPFF